MALAPSLAGTSVPSPPTGLRKNCLSVIENVAQALGTMAPTGGVAAESSDLFEMEAIMQSGFVFSANV